MSTWFKQVANNGLSYLNAQIEPLRHRQKYGKSSEEISIEIKNELQTTISRERDVERKIEKQEENRKKIRSQHQELNFRVQNLDENRQFLFKQTSDYEQKLETQAQKQKKLLMTIDKLKTQLNQCQNIKLRSISLNLKGATELKEGTLIKIPKLQETKKKLSSQLIIINDKHKIFTNNVDELTQKRDSLRNHLINSQKQHETLLNKQKKILKLLEDKTKDQKPNNELIEVKHDDDDDNNEDDNEDNNNNDRRNSLDDMTTIFEIEKQNDSLPSQQSLSDNSSSKPSTPKSPSIKYNQKEWNDRISQAVSVITNLHNELNLCEKQLETKHLQLGKIMLEKLNIEKDLRRMKDMVQLQQETLQSIENSRIEYSVQQQKYLKLKVNLQTKIETLQITLNNVKDDMKKFRDDIQAIKEASNSLSQKKFDLANKLKKTIDKENEIEDGLKILHRNRMSLRSRKSQLLKQQMSLQEQTNESTMKYTTQIANVLRCDCNNQLSQKNNKNNKKLSKKKKNQNGIFGQLTISKEYVEFVSSSTNNNYNNNDNNNNIKYNIKHEIIDISHSSLINYSSTTQNPMLLLYLNKQISYQGLHKYNNNNLSGNNDIDNCYKFKIIDITNKDTLLLMHNFIETKRDLLDKLNSINNNDKNNNNNNNIDTTLNGKNELNGNEEKKINNNLVLNHHIQKNNFSIWDIEIEDEFYCNCCSGYELRQIITSCPTRTHMWKWKLFYSTAIHGISMNTLYHNCESMEESILIIKDSINNIFGAFIDVEWSISTDYRGSIDCFVFQFVDNNEDNNDHDDEEKDNDNKQKQKSKHKLIVYKSSGQQCYFIRNDMESITIGAGECPAIYFDCDLNFGRSTNCSTFDSPSLSNNTQFQITTLEVWGTSQ